jgi:hypothetical protein
MATKPKDIIARIKENDIEWVDLRFTDPKGKWQHLTMVASILGEDELEDGLMFDGSSIEGWKAINESDMILKPDLDAVYDDPFSATPMLVIFCDIVEPSTGEGYARDPRTTAKRAEAYVASTGIGDTVYVGPEAEFFMFDDVRFETGYNKSGFEIDDIELPTNTGRSYEGGNLAHRPRAKGGYFPVAPVDSAVDIRAEMVSTMLEMGLPCDKHHHEVAAAQHELGLTFGTLTETADRMQIYKYVVHQVAHAYARPRPSCRSRSRTITAAGCTRTSRSGKRASRSSRATATPAFRTCASISSAVSSSMPRHSTPSPTRRRTATNVSSRASKRRCCSPIRRATVRPRAASRTVRAPSRSASSSVSPTRWPTPISAIRRC